MRQHRYCHLENQCIACVLKEYPNLRLPYAALLEPRRSQLRRLKSTFSAENSCASCLGLSPATSAQFTLEMCVTARSRKNSLKPTILGVHGRSKSLMLIHLKISSPVLVMTGSMSVSI